MPFLAPLVPALIAGGSTVAGGLLGGRGDSSKPPPLSPEERAALATQTEIGQQGLDFARLLMPEAMNWLSRSRGAFNPALRYWSAIASGDRNLMTEALAPEIEAIGDQYSTAMRSARELSPRGGGTSAFLSELPFQQARDIGTLYSTARPDAISNLATAGSNLASTALGLQGNAAGFLGGSGASAGSRLGFLSNRRQIGLANSHLRNQFGSQFGAGIYEILSSLPWDTWFQGSGGGGGSGYTGFGQFGGG